MTTQSFRDYVATLPVKYTDSKSRDWYDMDVASLPALAKAAYEEYKAASVAAAKLRDKFETITRNAVDDQAIQWGHNYGKLSFTMLDATPKAIAHGKPNGKVSLSDWLAANAGR